MICLQLILLLLAWFFIWEDIFIDLCTVFLYIYIYIKGSLVSLLCHVMHDRLFVSQGDPGLTGLKGDSGESGPAVRF